MPAAVFLTFGQVMAVNIATAARFGVKGGSE